MATEKQAKLITREIGRYLAALQILGESEGATGSEAIREGKRILHRARPQPVPDLVDCNGNQVWPPRHQATRRIECICGGEVRTHQLMQYADTAMACCSARCAMKLRSMKCLCGAPVNRHDVALGGQCRQCRGRQRVV